jgi:hypothetical protein
MKSTGPDSDYGESHIAASSRWNILRCVWVVSTPAITFTNRHVYVRVHASDTYVDRESVPMVGIGPKRKTLEADTNKKLVINTT